MQGKGRSQMPETIGHLIGTNAEISGIAVEGGWERRENFGNLFAFGPNSVWRTWLGD
jgi:hypothetical protein